MKGESPIWLRIAEWPTRRKVVVLGLYGALYLALFLSLGDRQAFALRPLNLIFVLAAGLFFGARGGLVLGGLIALANVLLYASVGIFGPDASMLSGNLLSIVVGVGMGGVVGRVRDLSLVLRREVRLRKLVEQQKEELTALLVHDLKSPLSGVLGHAQLILEDLDDGRSSAEAIRSAAERMNRMVMNLLDINRAEDGQLRANSAAFELSSFLREIGASIQVDAEMRQQSLRIETLELEVRADRELLSRVLLNLADNALKYTPTGGRIELLALHCEGEGLELVVRDLGPGIPVGYEERIFEKYNRLDRDLPLAASASRGLGLHFCKLAVEAHGGRIWVEPNAPRGSAFRIRLPGAVVAKRAAA